MTPTQEQEELKKLQAFATALDSSAKVLLKDTSPFMAFIGFFVGLFNKRFKEGFATTICNRIYIPRSWLGRDLNRLLVHEVGHIQQCRTCGLSIHPWVGFPIYMLLYLLVFFPLGLAYPRYLFERGADAKAWAWSLAHGQPSSDVRARMEHFAETVSSWDYFKPWPRAWVMAGFQKKFTEVLRASQQG